MTSLVVSVCHNDAISAQYFLYYNTLMDLISTGINSAYFEQVAKIKSTEN